MTPQLIAAIEGSNLPQTLYPALEKAWDWTPKVSDNSHPNDSQQMIQGNKPIVLTHRYQFEQALGDQPADEFRMFIVSKGPTFSYDYGIFFREKNQDIARLAYWAQNTDKDLTSTHFILGLALGYPLEDIRSWVDSNI